MIMLLEHHFMIIVARDIESANTATILGHWEGCGLRTKFLSELHILHDYKCSVIIQNYSNYNVLQQASPWIGLEL